MINRMRKAKSSSDMFAFYEYKKSPICARQKVKVMYFTFNESKKVYATFEPKPSYEVFGFS